MTAAAGHVGDVLRGAGGLQVSRLVGIADDGIFTADINELGAPVGRVEGDAVRLFEAGGKNGNLVGFAGTGNAAEDFDFAAAAFGEKEIAVGGGANQPRVVEPLGVELDLKAVGRLGPGIRRALDKLRSVARRLGGVRLGKILEGDFVNRARFFIAVVEESGRGTRAEERRRQRDCAGYRGR